MLELLNLLTWHIQQIKLNQAAKDSEDKVSKGELCILGQDPARVRIFGEEGFNQLVQAFVVKHIMS